MGAYILRRLLLIVPTLLGILVINYFYVMAIFCPPFDCIFKTSLPILDSC